MGVTVVVGAQFGGEGKGKTTSYLSSHKKYDMVVRVGGPNSGHTISVDGKQVILRQVPAGVVNRNSSLYIAAGGIIDLRVLFDEIRRFGITPDRLKVDRNAVVMDDSYSKEESSKGLGERIGSTLSGTGIAVSKRTLRGSDVRLARDVKELFPYLSDVKLDINDGYDNGKNIIIEGTQGFGLSLYHTQYYPFCTSRDTTASGFLGEVGLSPRTVSEICLVVRTFPIRVGGNSGPLPNEIDWATLRKESGYPYDIVEFTSVTKKIRRVARFEADLVKLAAKVNRPTSISLMGMDYLSYDERGKRNYDDLSKRSKEFIWNVEKLTNAKVVLVGTGPTDFEILERGWSR